MPLVYADTSALFAFFHPKDQFPLVLMDAVQRHSPDFVYWSFMAENPAIHLCLVVKNPEI
jgi:hypothetical protein